MKLSLSRRRFLEMLGFGAAYFAAPRIGRASTPPSVKRVLVVFAQGGLRWASTFDGQADDGGAGKVANPWGTLNLAGDKTNNGGASWSTIAGNAPKPQWGFSRMLAQIPLPMGEKDWAGKIYPYLEDNDPTHYNTKGVALPLWGNKMLPGFAEIASSVAVVRNTANPGGAFDSDHSSAVRTLCTGHRSGSVGMITALQHYLKKKVPAQFAQYALPAVVVGGGAWSLGVGEFASSRPIVLSGPTDLPAQDPGSSVAPWGLALEQDYDLAAQQAMPSFMGQSVADFINDKAEGDTHVKQLVDPALQVTRSQNGSATFGTLLDGTPVSNDMLAQAFALTDTAAAPGDPIFQAFAAEQDLDPIHDAASAKWNANTSTAMGSAGALAVRLLQMTSPIVCIHAGATFDSHSSEVVDPQTKHAHPVQIIQLARLLTGLQLTLKSIVDPLSDPKAPQSLWDTTVVFVCSEFGRGVMSKSITNGFNNATGANGGGSDHHEWAGWPVMGGPVVAGGKLLTAANGGFLHQNQVFTTILQGMGVTGLNENDYLDYGAFPPLTDPDPNGSGLLLAGV